MGQGRCQDAKIEERSFAALRMIFYNGRMRLTGLKENTVDGTKDADLAGAPVLQEPLV